MGGKPSRSGYTKIEDGCGKKIKVVVLGDSVGKSTLIRRFTSDKKLKTMVMENSSAKAEKVRPVWTTAELNIYECHGPKIRLLFSFLLRNADIVFKVFDTTSPKSRLKVMNKYSRTIKFKAPKAKVFLVGNKADVDVIDAEKGVFDVTDVDSKHGMIKHLIVSAETGYNVERLFSIAVSDVFPEGAIEDLEQRTKPPNRGLDSFPRNVDSGNHRRSYKMDKAVKGLCLIINNKRFDRTDLPPDQQLQLRDGTNIDAEKVRNLFTSLGFDVRQRDDLTDTEMLREVNIAAITDDHSKFNCFVCCILSHGSEKHEGSVYGSNCRDIAISSLTYPFQARNCPSLAGKPKLFFIQACQGDKLMQGQVIDVPDVVPANRPRRFEIIPDEADFLLMLSTCPGYVAVRNIIYGSHFINELINTIRQQRGCSMMEIATTVCNNVAQRDFGGYHQVPCLRSTLRKSVILH